MKFGWMVFAGALLASTAGACVEGPVKVVGTGEDAPAARIVVEGAWARAVPPVSKNSAGYLVITNRGPAADALVGARIDGVRVTELHEMVRSGESMTMRRLPAIELPAQGTATLAPGGKHLMLIDLQRPLRAGEQREGILLFRDAGEVKVTLEVRTQ